MNIKDFFDMTTRCAIRYRSNANESIQRNRHMNNIKPDEVIEQRVIDAILVDFINNVAVNHGVDYALYTKDLGVPNPVSTFAKNDKYKIVDKHGAEMPRHYTGRFRTLEEATTTVSNLTKHGEFTPYKMIKI